MYAYTPQFVNWRLALLLEIMEQSLMYIVFAHTVQQKSSARKHTAAVSSANICQYIACLYLPLIMFFYATCLLSKETSMSPHLKKMWINTNGYSRTCDQVPQQIGGDERTSLGLQHSPVVS